jgi:hypothetical protein
MMSVESERALERINLMLTTYCVVVSAFWWITSPRPASGDAPVALVCFAGLYAAFPFLVVTSGILLFSNRERAGWGFAASLFTIVAGSLSSIAFH